MASIDLSIDHDTVAAVDGFPSLPSLRKTESSPSNPPDTLSSSPFAVADPKIPPLASISGSPKRKPPSHHAIPQNATDSIANPELTSPLKSRTPRMISLTNVIEGSAVANESAAGLSRSSSNQIHPFGDTGMFYSSVFW